MTGAKVPRRTDSGGRTVHRRHNGLKTAVLLGGLSALILGHRQLLRPDRADRGARHRPRHQRLRVLEQRQARAARDARPAGQRVRGARAVPDRPRAVDRRPPAHAAAVHLADRGAQRLRHRPQPAQRRGVLHRGHPAHPRRARAARRHRPRAEPRLQPRHPHLLGRRRPRLRGHVPGQLRLADPHRPLRRRRGPRPPRHAADA